MSIDITYSEEKEKLEQDRKQLKRWLKDVKLCTDINKFTIKDDYIDNYVQTHKHLTIEELESRLVEIENIFYTIHN